MVTAPPWQRYLLSVWSDGPGALGAAPDGTPGETGVRADLIGHTLVVHGPQGPSARARELAGGLAPDRVHDLVIVDLATGASVHDWEAVAERLPRRRRGLRLIVVDRDPETTTLAGRWLSHRLGRPVIVPDGALVPGAGGSLMVGPGSGAGWVRMHPRRPPEPEQRRFPPPSWDRPVLGEPFDAGSGGVAEPVPAGLWVRPDGDDAADRRTELVRRAATQATTMLVALGAPGPRSLSLDTVAAVWDRIPDDVRPATRFVQFGPIEAAGSGGQAVADRLGTDVVFYTGLPVVESGRPGVRTVGDGGDLGWKPPASAVRYAPHRDGRHPAPAVLDHLPPVVGLPETVRLLMERGDPGGPVPGAGPAAYWYTPDTVVEVVQSGLYVRDAGAGESEQAARVREAPLTPAAHAVVYDDSSAPSADRLGRLAEDLVVSLDPELRSASRVLGASALLAGRAGAGPVAVTASGPAGGTVGAPAPAGGAVDPAPGGPERPVAVGPIGAPPGASGGVDPAAPAGAPAGPVPHDARTPAPTPVRVPAGVSGTAPAAGPPAPTGAGPGTPADPSTSAFRSFRRPADGAGSHPRTPATGATAPRGTAAGTGLLDDAPPGHPGVGGSASSGPEERPAGPDAQPEPAPTPDAPAGLPPGPAVPPRAQPVPPAAASAVAPGGTPEREQEWLRRTLGAEFGVRANAVSRILSEHPGFQSALSRSPDQVVVDAVAVQTYLGPAGPAVDAGLRSATVGPHVPLARCVVTGLNRLPSHRGATTFTVSPAPGTWDHFRPGTAHVEQAFLHALTAPAGDGSADDTDVLIWSMTGRRTRLLERASPGAPERVLFVPGTAFLVLEAVPADGGERGRILLREAIPADEHTDAAGRASLDRLAAESLRGQLTRWAGTTPAAPADADLLSRTGRLPGLAAGTHDDLEQGR